MTDVTAGQVPWPNMQSEAEAGMVRIYQMGMLHAAFLLRATDFEDVPDVHADRLARFIEANANHSARPAPWKLPGGWDDG